MSPNYPVHKTEKTTKDFNEPEYHEKFENKENGNHKGRVLISILLCTTVVVSMQITIMRVSMEMVTSIQISNQNM